MASSLVSAVQAVKDKIALAAGTATPEELAYLGTALDRIGGRATVYEVVEMGDAKMAELTALAETLAEAINADTTAELADFVASVDAKIAAMVASANILVDTSIENITGVKNSATAHASSTLTATTTAITAAKTAAVAEVAAAASSVTISIDEAAAALSDAASIAQQQALNGSMFVNHFFASIR